MHWALAAESAEAQAEKIRTEQQMKR